MKYLLVFAAIAAQPAQAKELKVAPLPGKYVVKSITATEVRGVKIRVTKNVVRKDCNRFALDGPFKLVNGTGDGYYDRYLADMRLSTTAMYCPISPPVRETVKSEPIELKSFTNENAKGEVGVQVILPEGFSVEAEEIL